MTKVTFVTAASPHVGGGHVLRCLALAESLAALGAEAQFMIDKTTLETVGLLGASPFRTVEVPSAAAHELPGLERTDIVIFDGYDLDIAVERAWRDRSKLCVTIDDLANRPHDCDVLVDHSAGRGPADYAGLVPHECAVLAGPSFALLRPEFQMRRAAALARRGAGHSPRRVLVAMGLTDVGGISRRAVEAVLMTRMDLAIDVVVGRVASSLPWLAEQARNQALRLHVDLEARAMADLMVDADMAIGSGGGTSLERCCLGLPSLVVLLADNQRRGVASLARAGAVTPVGELDVAPQVIARALEEFAGDRDKLANQARAAAVVVDGEGTQRVSRIVLDRLAAGR